eukprot:gene3819-4773_t
MADDVAAELEKMDPAKMSAFQKLQLEQAKMLQEQQDFLKQQEEMQKNQKEAAEAKRLEEERAERKRREEEADRKREEAAAAAEAKRRKAFPAKFAALNAKVKPKEEKVLPKHERDPTVAFWRKRSVNKDKEKPSELDNIEEAGKAQRSKAADRVEQAKREQEERIRLAKLKQAEEKARLEREADEKVRAIKNKIERDITDLKADAAREELGDKISVLREEMLAGKASPGKRPKAAAERPMSSRPQQPAPASTEAEEGDDDPSGVSRYGSMEVLSISHPHGAALAEVVKGANASGLDPRRPLDSAGAASKASAKSAWGSGKEPSPPADKEADDAINSLLGSSTTSRAPPPPPPQAERKVAEDAAGARVSASQREQAPGTRV